MEKSLEFYQEIAGLRISRRLKPNDEMEIAFLGDGGTQIELICNTAAGKTNIGNDISLGFTVESTAKFAEFLDGKGIKIHSGPFQPNPFIRFFYVLDPDGLRIQFVENIPG
jgi:lactoylglutathione lyase